MSRDGTHSHFPLGPAATIGVVAESVLSVKSFGTALTSESCPPATEGLPVTRIRGQTPRLERAPSSLSLGQIVQASYVKELRKQPRDEEAAQ